MAGAATAASASSPPSFFSPFALGPEGAFFSVSEIPFAATGLGSAAGAPPASGSFMLVGAAVVGRCRYCCRFCMFLCNSRLGICHGAGRTRSSSRCRSRRSYYFFRHCFCFCRYSRYFKSRSASKLRRRDINSCSTLSINKIQISRAYDTLYCLITNTLLEMHYCISARYLLILCLDCVILLDSAADHLSFLYVNLLL